MSRYNIILPVYNGGALLKECIASIISQTYRDFAVFVLDNNSNDGTLEWLRSLTDERIKTFTSTDTVSITENWRRINEIPKGEFMTIIGHDDLLEPHYIEEMESLILKHPNASLYQTHYTYIDFTGNYIRHCKPMEEVQYGHEFLACQLTQSIDSMGTGYMMRSRDFDSLGGMPSLYPNLIYADYQLWIMLSLISYKATAKNVCFKYRVHNSTSKLTNGELYQEAFAHYVSFLNRLKSENTKVKDVIEKHGHEFLMFSCESLCHRVLKTPFAERKIKVAEVIKKCKQHAAMLIPGQPFEPQKKIRIRVAKIFDSNSAGRGLFYFYRKMFKKKKAI